MPNYNAPLTVQPVQLENPLNNYAKMMAIQNSQTQNELARQQLDAARREEAQQNAMIPILQGASQNGEIDFGKAAAGAMQLGQGKTAIALLAAQKAAQEAKQKQVEAQYKLLADHGKSYKDMLAKVDPSDPNAASSIAEYIKAQHADPSIGPILDRMGVKEETAISELARSVAQPGGLNSYIARNSQEADKVVETFASKPVEVKDGAYIYRIEGNPRLPGFGKQINGAPIIKEQMNPYQSVEAGISNENLLLRRAEANRPEINAATGMYIPKPQIGPGGRIIQDATQQGAASSAPAATQIPGFIGTQAITGAAELRKELEANIKPLNEVQQRISMVKQLLATDSPATTLQIQQLLTELTTGDRPYAALLKGNANFGSLAGRVSGLLSKGFTGKYSESQREQIRGMVDDLQTNVVEPLRDKHITNMQKVAKAQKIPDELVPIPEAYSNDAPTGGATGVWGAAKIVGK